MDAQPPSPALAATPLVLLTKNVGLLVGLFAGAGVVFQRQQLVNVPP